MINDQAARFHTQLTEKMDTNAATDVAAAYRPARKKGSDGSGRLAGEQSSSAPTQTQTRTENLGANVATDVAAAYRPARKKGSDGSGRSNGSGGIRKTVSKEIKRLSWSSMDEIELGTSVNNHSSSPPCRVPEATPSRYDPSVMAQIGADLCDLSDLEDDCGSDDGTKSVSVATGKRDSAHSGTTAAISDRGSYLDVPKKIVSTIYTQSTKGSERTGLMCCQWSPRRLELVLAVVVGMMIGAGATIGYMTLTGDPERPGGMVMPTDALDTDAYGKSPAGPEQYVSDVDASHETSAPARSEQLAPSEQELSVLASRIATACSESKLSEDMVECQELCNPSTCCFEHVGSCDNTADNNCAVYGGCEALYFDRPVEYHIIIEDNQ